MNTYQRFVSQHWKKGKSWAANIRDIAKEWHSHKGTTSTTKKRVVHHHRVRRA